jgi:hypothetical protein
VVIMLIGAVVAGVVLTSTSARTGRIQTVAPPQSVSDGISAQQLAQGQWSDIAAPPPEVGFQASAVWTGSRLIVWGGAQGQDEAQLVSTGASYDPVANSWTVLPQAPISGRRGAAAVWTGDEMVVWGGGDNAAGAAPHAADDGAAFDPATNSWRRIPPAPIPATAAATALWADGEVVILGGIAAGDEVGQSPATAAAYQPATNQWRRLPDLPLPAGSKLFGVEGVVVGSKVIVFAQWNRLIDLGSGRSTASSGTDIYELDPRSGSWRPAPSSAGAPSLGVIDPVSSGSQILAIENSHCPVCRGPGPVFPAPSLIYDPTAGTWQPMQPGPVDAESSVAVWTGDALVRFNPTTLRGGVAGPGTGDSNGLVPGDTAAWDPHTDTWTRLPRAPGGATDVHLIWTGHELLMWGALFGPTSSQLVGYRYQPVG